MKEHGSTKQIVKKSISEKEYFNIGEKRAHEGQKIMAHAKILLFVLFCVCSDGYASCFPSKQLCEVLYTRYKVHIPKWNPKLACALF